MALIRWLLRLLRPTPVLRGFTAEEFQAGYERYGVYTPPHRPLTMFDWCNTDGTQKRGLITRFGKRASHIMRVKP